MTLLYNNSHELYQGLLADSLWAIAWVLAALTGVLVVLFVGGAYFSKSQLFRQIALSDTQDAQKGYTAPQYPDTLAGQQGTAQTPLHPTGKVQVDGIAYDAKTAGFYVEQNTPIVVMGVEGASLKVQALNLPK